MGTYLRVLSESYLMNTNLTGSTWFSNNLCVLVLWTKVAASLSIGWVNILTYAGISY